MKDVKLGSIVTIKIDYCDGSHPRGVLGVVCEISKSNTGGVQVVTEFGLIVSGGQKSSYFVPSDRYVVRDDDVVISEGLKLIRNLVLNGNFDPQKCKKITIQKAHAKMYGLSPGRKHGCNCKKECTA